jgi:hypothetical protein
LAAEFPLWGYLKVRVYQTHPAVFHPLQQGLRIFFLQRLFTAMAGRTKALRFCDCGIVGHLKVSFSNADVHNYFFI